MELSEIKKKTNPVTPYAVIMTVTVALVVIWSWNSTEMSVSNLLSGWSNMMEYMAGNPDIEGSSYLDLNRNLPDVVKYSLAILETMQMAIIACVLSVILAVPLSFFASRNILEIFIPGKGSTAHMARKLIYFLAMTVANVFRSINEIVWALIFVSAVGLGPMAGILALGIHTGGVLAKLLAEGNEAIDQGPVDALIASGAGFLKVIRFAVVPQIMPHFISMLLYRFESDVRSASILGFVGAGGIGFYLFDALRGFQNGNVATILLLIVVTVWCIDKVSATIRKKVI
jgi:phosphonate transport system permease protein